MTITSGHWIHHRPFVYHFAPVANIERIIKRREMLSAQSIVSMALEFEASQIPDPESFLSTPRRQPLTLRVGHRPEDTFVLNDQLPMVHESSFAGLEGTREEFIALLNGFVFFWPGKTDGPVTKGNHGQTFRRRYNEFAELRIPVADLWTKELEPLFCRFNSGAPQARDRVIRGPHIFVSASTPDLLTEKVVEIVFEGKVVLPTSTQWRANASDTWQSMAAS